MRFYTLFSTAASRAIKMQSYGEVPPALQEGFQNYLQRALPQGLLSMFASKSLTVRIDTRCSSPEEQNMALIEIVTGLRSKDILSFNINHNDRDTPNGKLRSYAIITIDKVDPQAITQLIAEESCEQTTTTPRNK
jgi:hypothetical protein